MNTHVLPLLAQYPGVRIVLRHQIQPWHPSSTLVHEAALAVERLAPVGFLPFSAALFSRQREFFDVSVVAETRNQTYARLAALAAESAAVDSDAVLGLLQISHTPGPDGALNSGNKVNFIGGPIHSQGFADRIDYGRSEAAYQGGEAGGYTCFTYCGVQRSGRERNLVGMDQGAVG